jgi:hypothetical protein
MEIRGMGGGEIEIFGWYQLHAFSVSRELAKGAGAKGSSDRTARALSILRRRSFTCGQASRLTPPQTASQTCTNMRRTFIFRDIAITVRTYSSYTNLPEDQLLSVCLMTGTAGCGLAAENLV